MADVFNICPVGVAPSIVQGQESRINFSDVVPAPGGETMVRGILLRQDFTWQTGGAGNAYEEPVLLRMFDRITVKVPGGWAYYDVGAQAGPNLRALLWAVRGERPRYQPNGSAAGLGDGVVNTLTCTTGLAIRLFLYIPFANLGGYEQDDFNVPLRDLIGSQLIVGYGQINAAAGGIFQTSADNQGMQVGTGTLTATAHLRSLDPNVLYRSSTRFSVTQHDPGVVQALMPWLTGKVPHFIIEVPTLAGGVITATKLADTDRTQIIIRNDSDVLVDRQSPRQMVMSWNELHARSQQDCLPHMESSVPFIPWFMPGRRQWKSTGQPTASDRFRYEVLGNIATPRILCLYSEVQAKEQVKDRLVNSRVQLPATFSQNPDAHTDSQDVEGFANQGPSGTQRFPFDFLRSPKQS